MSVADGSSKRNLPGACGCELPPPAFFSRGCPACWTVRPTYRVSLSPWFAGTCKNHCWEEEPHRDIWKCIYQSQSSQINNKDYPFHGDRNTNNKNDEKEPQKRKYATWYGELQGEINSRLDTVEGNPSQLEGKTVENT